MSDIGYKKPPEAKQYKPGQSGNPKGKKKGLKSLKAMVVPSIYPIRTY
jgi:hypothetical protein